MTEEYLHLFGTISNTIEQLEAMKQTLIAAQQKAEELFLQRTD